MAARGPEDWPAPAPGRIWGLFRRDIAHDRLHLGMTLHKLIDGLSKTSVLWFRSAVMTFPCARLKCRAANGRRRAHPPQLKQRYGLAGSSLRRAGKMGGTVLRRGRRHPSDFDCGNRDMIPVNRIEIALGCTGS